VFVWVHVGNPRITTDLDAGDTFWAPHCNENVLSPTAGGFTDSDPLVAFVPLHAPDAAQDVALVDDHVKVTG
jgi:hypothetical protein